MSHEEQRMQPDQAGMSRDNPKALTALLDFVHIELKQRISDLLDFSLPHEYSNQAETCFSTTLHYKVAERWLVENHSKLATALHQRIADALTQARLAQEDPYAELKLLDEPSLQEVVLRAQFVNRLLHEARHEVVALELRLNALRQSGAKLNAKAFAPGVVAKGMLAAFKQLDIPVEAKTILIEAYHDHGTAKIIGFYTDLNRLLVQRGVLPTVGCAPLSPVLQGNISLPAGKNPTTANPGAGSAPGWPSIAVGTPMPADFAQLLEDKLAALQQALQHLTSETWQPGLLRGSFSQPPTLSLSPAQAESIDHLEAVFLDLIRDTRISERFRSEFQRLLLPMMSLRLCDQSLFEDRDNPVRRFLRQLALLGFRDKEHPLREFEPITQLVGCIASERAQEMVSFKSGADALYTIARNEVQAQLESRPKPRPRHAASVEEEERRENLAADAYRIVQSKLRVLSKGLEPPPVVQDFVLRLVAPWLMEMCQRHGHDSPEMKDCFDFAVNLFSTLEPSADENEHQSKVRARKKLLERIALEILSTHSLDKEVIVLLEQMTEYFDELNSHHSVGLIRQRRPQASLTSYLDRLEVIRAST